MFITHESDCLQQSDRVITNLSERVGLSQLSPRDKKWDDRRAEADRVSSLYQDSLFDALAGKIQGCSGRLEFGYDLLETGEAKLRLRSAWFCRVRHCPVCQWRRSLVWRAKAFKFLPLVIEAYPRHRFIFLTLTVKNCRVEDLRATLDKMNLAWMRLTKRKQFPAVGWIKSVEVTRGQDDSAHPHFHCLLMVKPSYFKGQTYISQDTWTELWKKSMRLEYKPVIHITTVKPKKGSDNDMLGAIIETMKYAVKPSDLIGNSKNEPTEKDREWLTKLTGQLKGTRAIATGGILKEYLRELENEPEDLIHITENDKEDNPDIASVIFEWEKRYKKYLYIEDDGDL